MEKDKTYTPWIHGARPKGYKKPSTIVGPDDAMRLAEKLFLKRRKAAEMKKYRDEAKEAVEAQRRYEAEKEQREQERKAEKERQEQQKKAENLAMNTYARNLFNTLKKAKEQKSIRQAFMQGALKLHPNKGGDAELFKKFKAIYNGKKM
jgi:ribonucleotide reductase alpha subunit